MTKNRARGDKKKGSGQQKGVAVTNKEVRDDMDGVRDATFLTPLVIS